jgi:hypothetical protein
VRVVDGAVLEIGHFRSTCLGCGLGADPREERHETRLGYGDHGRKGCGAVFVGVVGEYTGARDKRAIRALRPDLPWREGYGL